METSDIKGFREVDSCRNCKEFYYDNLEWIGKCEKYDMYFNYIEPMKKICDSYEKDER